ncbi:MAG: hypothetical protein DWC02_05390, partial [Candidatus Poseidoniales archaeon]
RDISFKIWNNASRIDIFKPEIDFTEISGWDVELLNTPDLAISPGQSSTYTVRVTSPFNAQAGDLGPIITPKAVSLRSGDSITGSTWQGLRVNSMNDVSIQLLDYPNSLTPGIPLMISVEVTNNGNGPTEAILDLPWSPETWDWWALYEGTNVTEGVPLSVSYDLENVKVVDLWLVLPPLEAPGEFHEVTISVEPQDGTDVFENDNSVMFESVTETIRQPKLDGTSNEFVIETGSTFTFNATAWNIGNAVDNSLRARLVLQTSTSSQEVIGFLSTENGLSKSSGEWINLNLGATESVILYSDILVSENCELNTIISATIELEGGSDDLGRPILKTITTVLMVGERRNVDLGIIENPTNDLGSDTDYLFWINLSSTSTQTEIYEISADSPDGWGVICDDYTIHIESTRIEIDQGHITTQKHQMRCEIVRESGAYDGQVEIYIINSDNRTNFIKELQITWSEPVTDKSMSNIVVYSGISGFVVMAIIALFVIRRRSNSHIEFEEEDYDEDVPLTGPPATAFNGPPATVHYEEPQMTEYERQVQEYNRKVAEYEAWQAAQGSQPVVESTVHE